MSAVYRLIGIVLLLSLSGTWSRDCLAQERSLYWKSVDVAATLDSAGRLHVRETQTIVFDGEWNGGERHFRVRPGQKFAFTGLTEIDPKSGERRAFTSGSLAQVGEFAWFDDHLLRWRSRLPADPPFHSAVRVYELDYVLSNILLREGSGYLLDHDFAFADRSGVILAFSRRLQLDSAWQPVQSVPATVHLRDLAPGQGAVERIGLQYVGAGAPAAVSSATSQLLTRGSDDLSRLLIGGLVVLGLFYAVLVVRHEHARGRLTPLVPVSTIDATWLAEYVLKFPAEVVGAAWDRKTSTHEVAAVLARMTFEGKLSSEVKVAGSWIFKHDVLHLHLLCDVSSLQGYELRLVKALFRGKTVTDSDTIRFGYRTKGFDPVALIEDGVERRANSLVAHEQRLSPGHWWLTLLLIVMGVATCGVATIWSPGTVGGTIVSGLVLLLLFVLARVAAAGYRLEPVGTFGAALRVLLLLAIAIAGLSWAFLSDLLEMSAVQCIGLAILAWGFLNSVHNAMVSRETPPVVAMRNRLLSARCYFEYQLRTQAPQLRDEWLPYILAFGLGPKIDRWFRRFGPTTAKGSGDDVSSGSLGSSGGVSSSNWTGGGGMFGGAGASGAWVSAVGGIAAGVTAAGSGSDSGGGGGGSSGGGGGGSSGGGGGGGW